MQRQGNCHLCINSSGVLDFGCAGVLTKSGGEEDEEDEGDKKVDRKQIKGLGSARRPPPVFYSVGLALEVRHAHLEKQS